MGVIDDDHVQNTKDPAAVVGRKSQSKPDEVKWLAGTVQQFVEKLASLLTPPPAIGPPPAAQSA